MTRKQFPARFALLLAMLATAAPASALDMRFSPTPGNAPGSLKDDTLGINRADGKLFWKRPDGSPGVGTLLNALPSGRRAVEQGQADELSVTPGTTARTLMAILGDQVNVLSEGAKCDGMTDDTLAFRAAISRGKPVTVPVAASGGGACIITGTLTPRAGQSIRGLGGLPILKLTGSATPMLFDLTGRSGVELSDLTLDGSASTAAAGQPFIKLSSTTDSRLQRLDLVSPTGNHQVAAINLSAGAKRNAVEDVKITNSAGMAVNLTGEGTSGNAVRRLTMTGVGDFGVRMGEGANGNEVSNSYCNLSRIECYATNGTAHHNRFLGNHAEGSGDNGISVSGYDNVVSGNQLVRNARAGIYVWGSANVITGNHGLSNNLDKTVWPCIGANADYGGTGQNNTIVGNTCDDDQATPTQLGIVLNQPGYAAWSAGAPVSAGSYVMQGLNVYYAGAAGTTGSTPPTHTSGSVSDGGVSWTYRSTFTTDLGGYNQVMGNRVVRYAGAAPYTDGGPRGSGRTNMVVTGTGAGMFGPVSIVQPGASVVSQNYTSASGLNYFGDGASNLGIVMNTTNNAATGALTFGLGGTQVAGRLEYDYGNAIWRIFSQGVARIVFGATTFRPSIDNTIDLGTSAGRWKSVNSYMYQVMDKAAIDGSGVYAPKLSVAPSAAPGAGQIRLFGLAGTNSGTCKLMVQAGTSAAPTTLADNIGSGC